jgi:2-hydroxymuconate-semialdehyde hydrolase
MTTWVRFVCAVVAILFALFLAGRWLAGRIETEEVPDEPVGPGTSFLTTRSGRVHVLDVGEGSPVLLIHGSGSGVAEWQEGFAELLARHHRVIGFDCYGFGASDRDHGWQYGLDLWSRQAIDVLDALEIERAIVFGHSAGGAVAALLAAAHPDRFRGAVFVGHGISLDPAQVLPLVPGVGELWAARKATLAVTFADRDRHRRRMEAAYRVRGTRAAFLVFVRRQYTVDGLRLLGAYEKIRSPVLQVHGTDDDSIPIEAGKKLSDRLSDTRFVAVAGSGHHVHLDAPDRLVAEIVAFAETLAP